AKAVPAGTDQAKAELETKLNVALRSYSLLQNENDTLKTGIEKSAADKAALESQLAAAKSAADGFKSPAQASAATAAQTDAVRKQLRQTQAQIATLTQENSDLKTRVAAAAEVGSLKAEVADATRKATEAQNSNRALAEENNRLKATLASVSQTVGRVVAP